MQEYFLNEYGITVFIKENVFQCWHNGECVEIEKKKINPHKLTVTEFKKLKSENVK